MRGSNGNLSRNGNFSTTGTGTGPGGLGSQGALVFDEETQRFFAVNGGDNSVSMMALNADGSMTMMSKASSGGKLPVSVTVHGDTVYVLNQGDTAATMANGNISGLRIQGNALVPIPNSTQPLSQNIYVRPTEVTFTPDGAFLLVAEVIGDKIDTFKVVNGVAQPATFQTPGTGSHGPFAFDFTPEGFLLVANFGTAGNNGTSSVSSYSIASNGTLTPITASLATSQNAACWIVNAGGFAYISNTVSNNLTTVDIDDTGHVTLHGGLQISDTTGPGAIDLAVSPDHGFLYSLAGDGSVNVFSIRPNGDIQKLAPLMIGSTAVSGLVAR